MTLAQRLSNELDCHANWRAVCYGLVKACASCSAVHVGRSITSLRGFWGVTVKRFINVASNLA